MGNVPYFRDILIAFFLFFKRNMVIDYFRMKALSLIFLSGVSATIPTNSPDENAAMVEGGTAWSKLDGFKPYVKLYIRPIMQSI